MIAIIQASWGTFTLNGASLPTGQPEVALWVEEKLTTQGVDGARWRQVHGQYPSFTLTGLLAATGRDNANDWANSVRELSGELVTLTIDYGSSRTTYRNVKVLSDPRPQATPHSAPAVDGRANLLYPAYVLAQVTMQLTEDAQ